MNNKIYIDNYNNIVLGKKNACGKARKDCGTILENCGYRGLHIYTSCSNILKSLLSLGKILTMIPRKANVVIQYPLGNNRLIIYSVLDVCKLKGCKITLLIHDISSLRYSGNLSRNEIKILSKANNIIEHNITMKKLLVKYIPSSKYYCLQAFDYFIDRPATSHVFDNTIVYAGNLQKSGFLHHLKNLGIKFHLYGLGIDNLEQICNDHVKYKGAFSQEDLSILSGDYGLVWDGVSDNTCDGYLGNYMRYNAPHKLSLYIVSHLPIIIWEQAGEAEFIVNNKLGFTINSLNEIKDIILKITAEEYMEMKNNVIKYAKRLTDGDNLKSVLNKIEMDSKSYFEENIK